MSLKALVLFVCFTLTAMWGYGSGAAILPHPQVAQTLSHMLMAMFLLSLVLGGFRKPVC